jgi:hypothetical protein
MWQKSKCIAFIAIKWEELWADLQQLVCSTDYARLLHIGRKETLDHGRSYGLYYHMKLPLMLRNMYQSQVH